MSCEFSDVINKSRTMLLEYTEASLSYELPSKELARFIASTFGFNEHMVSLEGSDWDLPKEVVPGISIFLPRRVMFSVGEVRYETDMVKLEIVGGKRGFISFSRMEDDYFLPTED